MDFKGYFATGDGKRCDPFTITDAYSRYLIRCQIVSRIDLSQVRAICDAAMREYGVPARIRTDNGVAADTLKFTDRIPPKAPKPFNDTSAIFRRIATIQRESLQRLDDDIATLTKYLKTEGASNEVMKALETLSSEQHAIWQAAVERIEDLMGD